MTAYCPDTNAKACHALAIYTLRLLYVADRQWNYTQGRWESATEWHERTNSRPDRRANTHDVLKMIRETKNALSD